jgi:hypothetical protein
MANVYENGYQFLKRKKKSQIPDKGLKQKIKKHEKKRFKMVEGKET